MKRTACLAALLAASTLLPAQSASAATNLYGRVSQIVAGLTNDGSFSARNLSFSLSGSKGSVLSFTGIEGVRALNGADMKALNDWVVEQGGTSGYKFTYSVVGSYFDTPPAPINSAPQPQASAPASDGGYKFTYEVLGSYFDQPQVQVQAPVDEIIMNEAPIEQQRLIAPPAVPEPATWAMMIGGLGLTGGALRRRRTALVTA